VLIGKQIEWNKVTYLTLIDLEKAFDNVSCNIIFTTLQEIGIEQPTRPESILES